MAVERVDYEPGASGTAVPARVVTTASGDLREVIWTDNTATPLGTSTNAAAVSTPYISSATDNISISGQVLEATAVSLSNAAATNVNFTQAVREVWIYNDNTNATPNNVWARFGGAAAASGLGAQVIAGTNTPVVIRAANLTSLSIYNSTGSALNVNQTGAGLYIVGII